MPGSDRGVDGGSISLDPLTREGRHLGEDRSHAGPRDRPHRASIAAYLTAKGCRVPRILIDADGCPVKHEVYRVAKRHGLQVTLVSNTSMWTPQEEWIALVVVDGQFDAADDWIVEHVARNDIVITADIPLASRCLKRGALVLGPTGRAFTDENIGDALASREILSHLRDLGTMTGGPAPFEKGDRSRFLQSLEEMIRAVRREP